jgi:hypothetical protein
MIGKGKRAFAAALATTAVTLTVSLFAAGSASAATQSTKVLVPPTITRQHCDPIVIVDRAPC